MQVIRGNTRGGMRLDWLDAKHSFSFGNWFDPERMHVGPLRVLNEDRVSGGGGFPPHPHRDMEIVTYVLSGALAHEDSFGHRGVIRAGESQFMRAGRGLVHSEMNASPSEAVHLLQVWFIPRKRGLEPTHEQRPVKLAEDGSWVDVAGGEGFAMESDAVMRAAMLPGDAASSFEIAQGREGYLFVAEGIVRAGAERLAAGDALRVGPGRVELRGEAKARLVLFDLGPLVQPA